MVGADCADIRVKCACLDPSESIFIGDTAERGRPSVFVPWSKNPDLVVLGISGAIVAGSRTAQSILVVVRLHHPCENHRFLIGEAGSHGSFLLRFTESGEKHASEDSDDGDHD